MLVIDSWVLESWFLLSSRLAIEVVLDLVGTSRFCGETVSGIDAAFRDLLDLYEELDPRTRDIILMDIICYGTTKQLCFLTPFCPKPNSETPCSELYAPSIIVDEAHVENIQPRPSHPFTQASQSSPLWPETHVRTIPYPKSQWLGIHPRLHHVATALTDVLMHLVQPQWAAGLEKVGCVVD